VCSTNTLLMDTKKHSIIGSPHILSDRQMSISAAQTKKQNPLNEQHPAQLSSFTHFSKEIFLEEGENTMENLHTSPLKRTSLLLI